MSSGSSGSASRSYATNREPGGGGGGERGDDGGVDERGVVEAVVRGRNSGDHGWNAEREIADGEDRGDDSGAVLGTRARDDRAVGTEEGWSPPESCDCRAREQTADVLVAIAANVIAAPVN